MPKIGINAHLLSGQAGYRRAGIHHYIAQILRHLPTPFDYHYHIFTQNTDTIQPTNQHTIQPSLLPTERRLFRIAWEQTALPLQLKTNKIDLFHSMAFTTPYLNRVPAIVTIYDLSFVHYPDRFPPAQRHYLTSQTRHACRVAKKLITIAESGRQDLHQHFKVPLDKIEVVYPAVDDHYRPLPQAEVENFRAKHNLPQNVIIHVGTLQPRKNIPTLIQAFAKLDHPDTELVLVGGKGWLYDEIFAKVTDLGLENRVRFTGYVSDEDLIRWYNVATLLVFPSVYEGFGLPIAEAMACGVPVVAANTSSIPEVAGNCTLLFDPQDVTALVKCITKILQNPEQQATMKQCGQIQAKKFRWQTSADKMQQIYAQVLAQ